ncbi:hypothetical protein D3C71_1515200 [compost metagenome]
MVVGDVPVNLGVPLRVLVGALGDLGGRRLRTYRRIFGASALHRCEEVQFVLDDRAADVGTLHRRPTHVVLTVLIQVLAAD